MIDSLRFECFSFERKFVGGKIQWTAWLDVVVRYLFQNFPEFMTDEIDEIIHGDEHRDSAYCYKTAIVSFRKTERKIYLFLVKRRVSESDAILDGEDCYGWSVWGEASERPNYKHQVT